MSPATIRHLTRAPITEAVIDLRVRLSEGAASGALSKLPPHLEPRYPIRQEQRGMEGAFEFSAGKVEQTSVDHGITGYRYLTSQEDVVLQLGSEGFTFSKLHPYTSWDDIVAEAQQLWRTYVEKIPVATVWRVAVRYINNFTIPPGRAVADYLTAPPALPEGLGAIGIKAALSRLLLADGMVGANCLLTQALDPPNENGIGVVLDIDVYNSVELEPASATIWELFQQLRDIKNRIFFGSLHEVAVLEFE